MNRVSPPPDESENSSTLIAVLMPPDQGINPEQILTREALAQHATTYQDPAQLKDRQLQLLGRTLRELIHQETRRLANVG